MHFLNKNYEMWCPDGPTGFPKYPNASDPSVVVNGEELSCEDLYDIRQNSTSLYMFLMPIGVLATVIACLSCTWGFRLANTRYFTIPVTQFQTGAVATVAAPVVATNQRYAPPQQFHQQGVIVGAQTVVVQEQAPGNKAVPAVIIA